MIGSLLRIRYEVVQELDEGPIFVSYRVRDRVGGREVKARIINPPFSSEAGFLDRVRDVIAESNADADPNRERLLELDDHEGTPFLLSELPSGIVLQDKIKKMAPFSAPTCIVTAIGICEGLLCLHEKSRAHGDLNTANIFVNQEGKVKLALAGMWRAYGASRTAGSVVLPMMAPYLAPEVTQGAMPSPTTDVYSVGIILYELLTGRYPFSADTPVAMAMKHSTAPVPGIRAQNNGVPQTLEEIVKKCLAKVPHDRYMSAAELLSDLRMMQDALRFGKQLSWPIKSTGPLPAPTPEPAPQLVAPRMSAIRPESKQIKRPPEEEPEVSDRLPRWLTGLGYLAALALIAMIGGYMYWNFTTAKPVKMPSLVGQNVSEASEQLKTLGLKLVTDEVESNKLQGTIIKTDPRAGLTIREGDKVVAQVSSGTKFIEIPPLKGRSVDEVKRMLHRIGLNVDPKLQYRANPNFERGIVVRSIPEERHKLERGKSVRLVVSSGSRSEGDGQNGQYHLYTVRLGPIDVPEPVYVRIDMTDDEETRQVWEGRLADGEEVVDSEYGRGDQVEITIYFDGQIVSQKTVKAKSQPSGGPSRASL